MVVVEGDKDVIEIEYKVFVKLIDWVVLCGVLYWNVGVCKKL